LYGKGVLHSVPRVKSDYWMICRKSSVKHVDFHFEYLESNLALWQEKKT
jgi:hypothetical protein